MTDDKSAAPAPLSERAREIALKIEMAVRPDLTLGVIVDDVAAIIEKELAAPAPLREPETCWCDSLKAAGALATVKCPPCLGREIVRLNTDNAKLRSDLAQTQAEKAQEYGLLREQLAALCHEQWSGWMKHLFSKCGTPTAGPAELCKVIPPEWCERWSRQMYTPYADLSEQEKNSDRIEADRILEVVDKAAQVLSERLRTGMEDVSSAPSAPDRLENEQTEAALTRLSSERPRAGMKDGSSEASAQDLRTETK